MTTTAWQSRPSRVHERIRPRPISRSRIVVGSPPRLPAWAPSCAVEVDAFENERELCRFDRPDVDVVGALRLKPKAASLQALRPHRNAVAIPVDDAHPVTSRREE